ERRLTLATTQSATWGGLNPSWAWRGRDEVQVGEVRSQPSVEGGLGPHRREEILGQAKSQPGANAAEKNVGDAGGGRREEIAAGSRHDRDHGRGRARPGGIPAVDVVAAQRRQYAGRGEQ